MDDCSLKYYSDVTSRKIDWLWYPYIPFGKITVIQGDPGEGKTTFVLSLLSIISNGEKLPFSDNCVSGKVIYQNTEDDNSDKKSQISIKVPRNLSDEKNNMRIHSKSFCYALAKSQGWDWQYSYRVPGIANKEQGIVIFDLTKAEIISESFTNRNS